MNETVQVLTTRRSVRKFKDQPVPREVLDEILKAGIYAPSGLNSQSPVIVEISGGKTREAIQKENAKIAGLGEGADPFYGAPVVLLVAAKKDSVTPIYDGSCALSNMMNAAWSMGIASCWVHRAAEEVSSDFGKDLFESLGIEGEYIGVGHLALGYADGECPAAKPRRGNRVYRAE